MSDQILGDRSTKLVGDRVYFPSGGINPDSNGIIIRPEEAIESVNLEITGSEIRPRFGTISIDPFIADLPQPLSPIIHYHDFLEPGGSTTIFGFTNSNIYKYTKGLGWSSVLSSLLVGGMRFDQWSTTDFVDLEFGSTVVAAASIYTQPDQAETQGTNRLLLFYNRTAGEFQRLNINYNFPITEEDVGVTAPAARVGQRYINDILFEFKEYHKWIEGSGGAGFAAVGVDFNNDGATDPAFVSVSMFSNVTTPYTDSTSDIEEATSARITITYNVATVNKTKVVQAINDNVLASQILQAIGESATFPADTGGFIEIFDGVSGIVTGTLVHKASLDLDFVKITPNLFFIKTEEGTLAACGTEVHSIGGKDCYRLLPVNNVQIAYGDDSYVAVDGSIWSIAFTTDIFAGDQLYVDYYYERTGNFYPKIVRVFRNALMFANTYEGGVYYPWRIRYTVPADMTITNDDWFTDLVVDDTSGIRAMKTIGTAFYNTLGTYLYVYKDQGIVRGSYNPNTFIEYDTAFKEGVYATRTIQDVDGMQIFLGTNDIYAFDGVKRMSLTYDPEMKGTRIREYLMSILDPIVLKNTFAVYDRFRRKYILFIKGRREEFPTKALCYDIDRKIWVRYEFPTTSAAIHVSMELSFNTIDSLSGTIAELAGTIDELGGSSTNEITLFAMTNQTYTAYNNLITDKNSNVEDTAVSKIHTLITRDFLFKSLEEAERVSLMKFEALGDSVTVRYSTEYDTLIQDFVAIPGHLTFPLSGRYKTYLYNCDVQGDKIRFSFSSTKDFRIRWMQVFSIQTTEITEA